jgi:heat shock protein HslJ
MIARVTPQQPRFLLVLLAVALLMLAACGRGEETPAPLPTEAPTEAPTAVPTATPVPPTPTATPLPLPELGDGSTWTLTTLNGEPVALPGLVTATFGEGGLLTGISGCNNYSAGFTVDGDAITIEPPVTTRKMCADPRMALEEDYLAALTAAATFTQEDHTLTLFDADGVELAGLQSGVTSLQADSTWRLVAYRRPDGTLFPVDRALPIDLTIGDGSVTGSTPCQTFTAPITLAPRTLEIGTVTATPLEQQPTACMDRGLAAIHDAEFVAALANVAAYELTAEALTLFTADGTPLALLIPPAFNPESLTAAEATPTPAAEEEATPPPAADEESAEATPAADEEAAPDDESTATPEPEAEADAAQEATEEPADAEATEATEDQAEAEATPSN